MFSRNDIMNAIADGHLKIYPYEKKNLTGIGYNISTTNFAFSTNKGILLTIHKKTTSNGISHYVTIPPNDTVLFFSKEYIALDNTIAGTFHSKVSRVCQGLGHNSTTLDPTWKGQLIISVNNPKSSSICFDLDKDSGNILTLLLHKLDAAVTGPNIHDNNQGRCDLLLEHFSQPSSTNRYLEKHLQLKEFVSGEYADSLNGYDSFLKENEIEDKYSQKVSRLARLRDRLENDIIFIEEGRYRLGDRGEYVLFKNQEEKQLIQNCAIFELKGVNGKVELSSKNIVADASDICRIIKLCLDTINYELEMINHIRRINWQNKKFEEFAGEGSELVKLRQEAIKRKLQKRFFIPLAAVCAILFAISNNYHIIYDLSKKYPTTFNIIATVLLPPAITLLLALWLHSFLNPDMREGETFFWFFKPRKHNNR